MLRLFVGSLALAIAVAGSAYAEDAAKPTLDGSWTGSGMVTLSNGQRERARCNVRYQKYSETSYKLAAKCSTATGIVNQTAVVKEAGANKYKGNFRNPDYNVAGNISVVLNSENKQTATVTTSGKGKGILVLAKR